MTDRELKWLKKVDLLELLISQSRENELLKQQLEEARQTLAEREIDLSEAGSIAEASLQLNGVFQSVQRAADQYMENVRRMSEKQQRMHEKRMAEAQAKAEQLLAETQAKCKALERETAERCRQMLSRAKQQKSPNFEEAGAQQ